MLCKGRRRSVELKLKNTRRVRQDFSPVGDIEKYKNNSGFNLSFSTENMDGKIWFLSKDSKGKKVDRGG